MFFWVIFIYRDFIIFLSYAKKLFYLKNQLVIWMNCIKAQNIQLKKKKCYKIKKGSSSRNQEKRNIQMYKCIMVSLKQEEIPKDI